MKRKAVVAMSGGVDSSVAVALMKEAGYEVTGIMMKLWDGPAANNESGCCSLDAAEDARRVAQVLDIPFYVHNFAAEFNRTVVADFVEAYSRGYTPNPCVTCNRAIKFSHLLERARAYGADVLATGHYARVVRRGGRLSLLRGSDPRKDQSYVLYMLGRDEIARTEFPVGEHSKTEIREIAASLGLRTAAKPESQEICFVPRGDTHAFITSKVPEGSLPGPVIDRSGEVIGTHRGYAHYTIGQRRGLGVAARVPVYVREIRPGSNTIVVHDADSMKVAGLDLSDVSFVGGDSPETFEATVMTRYRGEEQPARVSHSGKTWRVEFTVPAPAAAPGQAAVFYDGEEVLGGGTIARAW